ncbi:hypothetical protein [Pararhizobium gei]|uniref:hypothetical protein n=1 Tax=Pararhizobium gei TaxID=1395951 RepID=UPI0023DA4E58|nr:hypothetical protein [Rhizobium gei]
MTSTDKTTVRIEVFRTGTFTPMEGGSLSYSAADLRAVADNYDYDLSPAPVVVGHPSIDAPAYAWAKSFDFDHETGTLHATVGEINPAFAAEVRKGSYKKVSLSLFAPDQPANPSPGTWYPKHIGFLGGAAPAVSGLRNVEFAADDDAVTFIAHFAGAPRSRVTVPAGRVTPTSPSSFAEREASFAEREAAFNARQAEFDAQQAEWKQKERSFAHAENVNFAETLISQGKMLPALRDRFVTILDAASVSQTVSFAEGEQPVPMLQALRDILSEQPSVVSFGAVNIGSLQEEEENLAVSEIAVPEGYEVDTEKTELYRRARELEARENISFAAALDMAGRKPGRKADVNRTSSARKF